MCNPPGTNYTWQRDNNGKKLGGGGKKKKGGHKKAVNPFGRRKM